MSVVSAARVIRSRESKGQLKNLIFTTGNHLRPDARDSVCMIVGDKIANHLGLEWKEPPKGINNLEICESRHVAIGRPRTYVSSDNFKAFNSFLEIYGPSKSVTVLHHDIFLPLGKYYACFGGEAENEAMDGISKAADMNDPGMAVRRVGIGLAPIFDMRPTFGNLETNVTMANYVQSFLWNTMPQQCIDVIDERVMGKNMDNFLNVLFTPAVTYGVQPEPPERLEYLFEDSVPNSYQYKYKSNPQQTIMQLLNELYVKPYEKSKNQEKELDDEEFAKLFRLWDDHIKQHHIRIIKEQADLIKKSM